MKPLPLLLLGCAITAFAAGPAGGNDFPEEKLDWKISASVNREAEHGGEVQIK